MLGKPWESQQQAMGLTQQSHLGTASAGGDREPTTSNKGLLMSLPGRDNKVLLIQNISHPG